MSNDKSGEAMPEIREEKGQKEMNKHILDLMDKLTSTAEWLADEERKETVLNAFTEDKEEADLMVWTSFEGDNIACLNGRGETFMVNYCKHNKPCGLHDDNSRSREPMRLFVLPVGSDSDAGQRAIESAALAGLTICEL